MGKRVIDLGTGEHDFLAGRVGDASRFHTVPEALPKRWLPVGLSNLGVGEEKERSELEVIEDTHQLARTFFQCPLTGEPPTCPCSHPHKIRKGRQV